MICSEWDRFVNAMIKDFRDSLGRGIDSLVDLINREANIAKRAIPWDQETVPDAILLDWDYHLVHSFEYYNYVGQVVVNHMSDVHGMPEPEKPYSEKFFQKSAEYYWQEYGEMAPEAIKIHEAYLTDVPYPPCLKEGALEFLQLLNECRIPYAIVSDAEEKILQNNVRKTLEQHDLPVPIVVGTSMDIVGKPEPDGIIKALVKLSAQSGRRLTAQNRNIVMIGDRPDKDGIAATKAGLSHIIIPSEKTNNLAGWFSLPDLKTLTTAMESALQRKALLDATPANTISI